MTIWKEEDSSKSLNRFMEEKLNKETLTKGDKDCTNSQNKFSPVRLYTRKKRHRWYCYINETFRQPSLLYF